MRRFPISFPTLSHLPVSARRLRESPLSYLLRTAKIGESKFCVSLFRAPRELWVIPQKSPPSSPKTVHKHSKTFHLNGKEKFDETGNTSHGFAWPAWEYLAANLFVLVELPHGTGPSHRVIAQSNRLRSSTGEPGSVAIASAPYGG